MTADIKGNIISVHELYIIMHQIIIPLSSLVKADYIMHLAVNNFTENQAGFSFMEKKTIIKNKE